MRASAVVAFLLSSLLVAPSRAEEPKPVVEEGARQGESCSACTGSLVKSWRIRKGDPKSPPPSKPLERQEKDRETSGFAD